MRGVSDTSPISNLASIGRLALLRSHFSQIWIPSAVSIELASHPDAAARQAVRGAIKEEWILPVSVAPSHFLNVLNSQLHRGEAEAIALAAALNSGASY